MTQSDSHHSDPANPPEVDESVDTTEQHLEVTTCKICGCDTTGWCLHGISEHKTKHFDEVNNTLPVSNDVHGVRKYKYHDMDFHGYTKYGKCLVLGGLMNSEFPNDTVVDMRDISALGRIRYLLMSAIMVGDAYNIATIAAERNEIDRLASLLFRDENWLHLMCRRLATDLQ